MDTHTHRRYDGLNIRKVAPGALANLTNLEQVRITNCNLTALDAGTLAAPELNEVYVWWLLFSSPPLPAFVVRACA